MSDERKDKKPKAPSDFSHIGGKKVGHPIPEKTEKEIDFTAIGGKVVRTASDHPAFKPEASVEKEEDARE